jgi:thymidylate synthase (FAD)
MQVVLKSITPNAEVNIVEIARVSSTRVDKTEAPEGLINYLIRNKHWSPFEHAFMTIEVETTKAIGIQMLRHRSFTFQEFSQRYAKVDKIEPTEYRMQAVKNRQSSTIVIGTVGEGEEGWMHEGYYDNLETTENHIAEIDLWLKETAELYAVIMDHYQRGIELGIAKECARMVLPMATQTRIYMSGTIRSWIHFLEGRLDPHAQKEIQLVAEKIKDIFVKECPIISAARGYHALPV